MAIYRAVEIVGLVFIVYKIELFNLSVGIHVQFKVSVTHLVPAIRKLCNPGFGNGAGFVGFIDLDVANLQACCPFSRTFQLDARIITGLYRSFHNRGTCCGHRGGSHILFICQNLSIYIQAKCIGEAYFYIVISLWNLKIITNGRRSRRITDGVVIIRIAYRHNIVSDTFHSVCPAFIAFGDVRLAPCLLAICRNLTFRADSR